MQLPPLAISVQFFLQILLFENWIKKKCKIKINCFQFLYFLSTQYLSYKIHKLKFKNVYTYKINTNQIDKYEQN